MGKKERLNEVYEYVRNHFPIHTQVDFAEKLKYHRTYISSAMHGNEKNLTDKLFMNICEAFPGVFNLDYLLTGKGSLLTVEEEVKSEEIEKQNNSIDQSSLVNAALAAKDETIAALREQIKAKDDLITVLHQQIELYKQQIIKGQTEEYMKDFPFAPGVAEGRDKQNQARV